MISLNPRNLSRRVQLIAVVGVIIAGTSSVAAFNTFTPSSAEETPVEVKVDQHEDRITKNESDIAETKDRVEGVEQQTAENTNTIHEVREQVVVVQGKQQAAQSQAAQPAPATAAPAPAPTPAPVKTINPRLIIAVSASPMGELWSCTYTLETGKVGSIIHPQACNAVGSEVSEDFMNLNGIRS